MTVAFCSLIRRADSVMNCSGFSLNFPNVSGRTALRIAATVRRVSFVFSAISPNRSYLTCDPAVTVSVTVSVVDTANPEPFDRSSASSSSRCLPDWMTYCMDATLRCLSMWSTAL